VIETAGHGYSFKIIVETGNWASTHRWEMRSIKNVAMENALK
jgi:hypothetical protein